MTVADVRQVREEIAERYPRLSRYPNIAGPLALHVAYTRWRKQRCYDRSEVTFGARTRSGEPGYRISFYSAPPEEEGLVDSIVLTGPELDELEEKIHSLRESHRGEAGEEAGHD